MNRSLLTLIVALFFFYFSCSLNTSNDNQEKVDTNQLSIDKTNKTSIYKDFISQIFPITKGGYGYNILMNGDTIIHQPHIPGIQGNRTFQTQEKAKKAAEFVIKKIQNNIMPPSVSVEELDSLGVL